MMPRANSMPSDNGRFNRDWLNERDINGHLIGGWCTAKCDHEVYCSVCTLSIEIRNNGKFQIMQHAARKKHKEKALLSLSIDSPVKLAVSAKPWLVSAQPLTPLPTNKAKLRNMSHQEKLAAAELLCVLKMAESGFSFESCENMCNVFEDMFPDSRIAQEMAFDKNKVIYEVTNGIAPFYHGKLIRNLKRDNVFYTITYDEPKGAGVKRLDIYIRFWSEKQGRVKDHFLKSHKIYSVSPDNIRRKVMETVKTEELDLDKWLMLGTSSPTMSGKILNDIDSDLKPTGHEGLVRIASCNAAVVHRAFRKGIDIIQHWEVDDLIDAVFRWFNKYPARKEDIKDMQEILELKDFYLLRYAADEWVALVPLITRILEQWEQIKKYFLEIVPRSQVRLTKSQLYKTIKALLIEPSTLYRLLFLKSASEVFEAYLATIQTDDLLLHTVHGELTQVFAKLLKLFVKPELFKDLSPKKLNRIDLERDGNLLKLDQMEIGSLTKSALKKMKPIEVLIFLGEAKKFLVAVASSFREKSPLDNPILANLHFLNPSARGQADTFTSVKTVAENMPQVIKVDTLKELEAQWKTYEEDNIEDGSTSYARIDSYWASVFKRENEAGEPKYPLLSTLVKAVLSLSQGQSHINNESFRMPLPVPGSFNKVGAEWEDTRNALKTLHSCAVQYGGTENVPITRKAIAAFAKTNVEYKEKLEAEKKAAEEKAAKEAKEREFSRPTASKEASMLLNEKATLTERVKDGSALVAKANFQLAKACRTKNMAEIMEAQELLESGHKQITDTYTKMSVVDDKLHRILKPGVKSPMEFT